MITSPVVMECALVNCLHVSGNMIEATCSIPYSNISKDSKCLYFPSESFLSAVIHTFEVLFTYIIRHVIIKSFTHFVFIIIPLIE